MKKSILMAAMLMTTFFTANATTSWPTEATKFPSWPTSETSAKFPAVKFPAQVFPIQAFPGQKYPDSKFPGQKFPTFPSWPGSVVSWPAD